MRTGVLVVLASVAIACGGGFFKQYEYEEDCYVSLDGKATMYVNTSVAALNALRGTSFDAAPDASADLDGIKAYFTTPQSRVERITTTRRNGRRYVHVSLVTNDLRRLSDAAPFSWSSYELNESAAEVIYHQEVRASRGGNTPGSLEWRGDEIAAFRLHMPSRILFHNSPFGVQRGNILAWEQPLGDRLRGEPIEIEVRVEAQSILYRTLLLFVATMVLVALMFLLAIWWVIRYGRRPNLERRT